MAADFLVSGDFKLTGDANAQAQIDRLIKYGVSAAKSGNQEIAENVEQVLARKLGQKYEAKAKVSLQYDSNTGEIITEQKKILPILDKANALIKKNTSAQQGSLTSLRGQQRAAAQLRDSIAKINPVTGKISAKWREADNAVKAANLSIARTEGNILGIAKAKFPIIGQIFSLGNAFGQAAFIAQSVVQAFQAISAAVGPIIARAKQLEGLTLALKGFGATSAEAADVLESAKRVALTYGASLTAVEKAYKRLTPAIVQSGGSFAETERAISALTARTTLLGLNTEQTGRYIEAFAQVMGKGKLQSEELTQQFSELDGALRGQLAAYFKAEKGVDNLEEAMKNGEIKAKDFREAFVAVSQTMTDKLAGAVGEVQQRLSPFNDDTALTIQQMQNLQATLDTLTVESLAKTFDGFGQAMLRVSVTTSQFFASIANDLPGLQRLVSDIFTAIGGAIEGTWAVVLLILKAVLFAIDSVIKGLYGLWDAIKLIPGAEAVFQAMGEEVRNLDGILRGAGNAILSLGSASVASKAKFADYAVTARDLTQAMLEGKISSDEYREKIEELKNAAAVKQDPEGVKVIDEAIQKVKDNLGGLRAKLDAELAGIDEIGKKLKEQYDAEKDLIRDNISAIKDKISEEKSQYDDLKAKIKDRYDDEISYLKDVLSAVKDRYAEELSALDALTPAEQRLLQIRRDELTLKARNINLSEKERLEAQASLDAMDRRAEKQKLQNQRKQEEKELTGDIKQLEKERDDQLKAARDNYQDRVTPLEEEINAQEAAIKTLDKEFETLTGTMDDLKQKYGQTKETLDSVKEEFNDQVEAARAAGDQYDTAAASISTMDSNLQNATTAAKNLNEELDNLTKITGGGENRFAGGSVSAGQTYTVNEAGQEAFLSASGRLSLINKKSWGQWTAPSSGTVIPAHLTSQLDIPAGGVNLKNAGRAAVERNPISARVGGSVNYGSSDNVTNNITIQSQAPVQDASKLMVDVIKRRNRRRF